MNSFHQPLYLKAVPYHDGNIKNDDRDLMENIDYVTGF